MSARSWWGWGREDEHLDESALNGLADEVRRRFDAGDRLEVRRPVDVTDLEIPAPRIDPPAALAEVLSADPKSRAQHAHGQSFRDVVRAFHGELDSYPDLVASPEDEDTVAAVLDWCADVGAACVPFGGGTSVVGGVTPPADRPVVCLDTRGLRGIVDVDTASRAARIRAGTTGPYLEEALRAEGLTLRFYPQSWEFSTLGGWVATRAGGHDATLRTHIDDLVESVRAITPLGVWESRRLPSSGAGPSPDRMLLGSEGILGVVTDAWVRVRPRPTFRADASVFFDDFAAGCAAVRGIVQAELHPANCRLLDPAEAALSGAGDGSAAVLVLGFESADHPLGPWMDRALEISQDSGGTCPDGPRLREGDRSGAKAGASGAWRQTFIRAPYLRDALVSLGMVVETFESAMTWDRLAEFVETVTLAARGAAEQTCGAAHVAVRLTHAYPDGAAPYWTVIAPGRRGAEVSQWDTIKAAVAEAIIAAGGTITHHHAVGRDHMPWYAQQRPEPFAAALAAAKRAVDPSGIMNPGVLL
jgi:alkyldihydroxyacetonephosphate synthase